MTLLRFAVASLVLLLLAGCASTDERSASRMSLRQANEVPDARDEYVARVEAIARRRGILVQWINLPPRRTADHD